MNNNNNASVCTFFKRHGCRASGLMLSLLGLLVGACSPLATLNSLTPEDSYRREAGIAYGEDLLQKLDVYRPAADASTASTLPALLPDAAARPVVLFFYGGTWRDGSRDDYVFLAEALASEGLLVFVADYRKYPQLKYDGIVRDSAAATAWVLRHAAEHGGDPRRVFVMGHSAGAYNAAMVAYDKRWLAEQGVSPRALAGFIGVAGPYNFLPMTDEAAMPVFDWPNTSPATQPINHVEAGAPPALLLAPQNDAKVNPEKNTEGFAEKLREKGVPVKVIRYDGVSHASIIGAFARPLRWLAPVRRDVVEGIAGMAARPASAPAMGEPPTGGPPQ